MSLRVRLGRVANELARKAEALERQGDVAMRRATDGVGLEAGALRTTAAARLRVALINLREARVFLARAEKHERARR